MATDETLAPAAPTAAPQDPVAALMEARAAVYGLLARVFIREVDEAFLAELRAMRYPQGSDNPAVNEAFREVYRFMRHAREDVLDVLAVDYSRTFLGSGVLNGNAAFPYESVYTSEHALVMQEARDEVLAIFRAHGMDKAAGWTDPEDHIALELEFMRTLALRTRDALAAGDEQAARTLVADQHGFLTAHLLNWAPRFLHDVPRFASTGFYRAFAALADAHLADDRALLEDIAQASGIELDGPAAPAAPVVPAAPAAPAQKEVEADV